MNFEETLRDLDGRQSEAKPEPSLDRIRLVADLLDHPELTYPSVHVTGTNGKTTTTRMIAALGCAQGLTTGAFISPHVTSLMERLSVCGLDMSEEEFDLVMRVHCKGHFAMARHACERWRDQAKSSG